MNVNVNTNMNNDDQQIVRDCFALAKKKLEETDVKGSIIFIDEVSRFF